MNIYITPEQYAIAEANGINKRALEYRLRDAGWSVARATTIPVQKRSGHGDWPQVAAANGINYGRFIKRTQMGWSDEAAATTPLTDQSEVYKRTLQKPTITTPEIKALAAENGIGRSTLRHRILKQGMDPQAAATMPPRPYTYRRVSNWAYYT